jgi:hypothetical protein
MSTQQNKDTVVRLYQEVATGKNLDLADELFTPYFVWHPSLPGKRGPEPFKRQLEQMHSIFTDMEFELHSVVAEGGEVAVCAT